MDKNLGLGLLIVGVVLLIFGFMSAESLSSDFSNFFTGSPTEKSIWLLIGGLVFTVWGASSFLRRT